MDELPQSYINWLQKVSKRARANIIKMTTVASSGHPGGSMSSIDFYLVSILFSNIFENYESINKGEIKFSNYEFNNIEKIKELFNLSKKFNIGEDIDAFFISHGHTSPGWYSALISFGLLNEKEVNAGFRLASTPFSGHVENIIPLVEWDTGNLGQGLSAASAKALYYKYKNYNSHIWVFMGDGEQQKGQISEGRRFIKKFGLTNITVIVDYNQLQISGNTQKVMPQNLKKEWESSGFKVIEINGHDFNEIYKALKLSYEDKNNNYCILANTVMGKGVSFMENKEKYHGSALPIDLAKKALEELDGIDDLEELINMRKTYNFSKIEDELNKIWNKNIFNNQKRKKFNDLILKLSEKPKQIYDKDKSTDCRSAYGEELLEIANEIKGNNGNIFVFDCDLAESVKTNAFEKNFENFFIQTGIQEHHAATCSGYLSKENALVFFSDFAIFGLDETFNQQRLNDINKCNLKGVYTHAGTNVGEDGKTHHCINYIALTSCYYNSMLILPSDPNHTKHVIRFISRNIGNFYVVMGRAKTPIILDSFDKPYYDKEYSFIPGLPDIFYKDFDFRIKNLNISNISEEINNINFDFDKEINLNDFFNKVVKYYINKGYFESFFNSLENIKADLFLFSCGPAFGEAYLAYNELRKEYNIALLNFSTPNFICDEFANYISKIIDNKVIFVTEDHNINNGLSSKIKNLICEKSIKAKIYSYGINNYAPSGDYKSIYKIYGIDKDSIITNIKNSFNT